MPARAVLIAAVVGLFLALASSAVPGRSRANYADIMGCEQGCAVAAAGWPLPYLVDYPGISVVGSAGLTGALTGEDHFRPLSFLISAAFWTFMAVIARLLWRRLTK